MSNFIVVHAKLFTANVLYYMLICFIVAQLVQLLPVSKKAVGLNPDWEPF